MARRREISCNKSLSRAHGALIPALLLLLAGFIATSGIATLPMDGHEAFVVQTTHEMQARNDWVVPWFNGEPRLNKPPLNYWLTGATAWASGTLEHIEAWQGRLVSALAALAMAIVTLFAANIPAFENIANLERLPATGAFVIALPMKIAGGSGGPLRIIAMVPR